MRDFNAEYNKLLEKIKIESNYNEYKEQINNLSKVDSSNMECERKIKISFKGSEK